MFDAQGRLVVNNNRYLEMYGLAPEQLPPDCTIYDLLQHRANGGSFTGEPKQYCDDVIAAIKHDKTFQQVTELSDGRVIAVSNRPTPDGGWLAMHEDITERRRTEIARDRAETFLNTIIEHIPAVLWVKDARDMRHILVNRAAEQLHGISRNQLIGKNAYELLPEAEANYIDLRDREALASCDRVVVDEFPVHTRSNGVRVVSAKRLSIRGQSGQPEYLMAVVEDVTERKRAEARIAHMAHHDALTDLPNRAAFNECINFTLEHSAAQSDKFALLCVDFDRFKEVNDVFGHSIGDALLRKVSRRLQAAAEGAFLARVGGDEFTLIASDGPQPANAMALADRLQAAMTEDFDIEGHKLRVNLSIGVAIYPADGTDTTTLLINADAALYRAKAEERGSVRFFEAEMDMRLRERRALQHDLRSAIASGEIELHYQPQARISGDTMGFEALVRWIHPQRGLIAPDTFVPLAEESGLIISIGEWILREACREAASWPHPLQIAVNLSSVQFRHGDLPALVHSVLLETGLSPGRLELEITESVLIDDFSRAMSILRRLKTLGVRIAMDDFGTGYSSLSYLQSFPFDKIKIDKTFIAKVHANPQSAAIVRAVIGLARALNMAVVAEGVETPEQLAFLQREGCDVVQGHLSGLAMPIEDYAGIVGLQAPRRITADVA
jgi:diguanylate cyclase (GGDEF)-like protein/PAS domain S-box-containing protein